MGAEFHGRISLLHTPNPSSSITIPNPIPHHEMFFVSPFPFITLSFISLLFLLSFLSLSFIFHLRLKSHSSPYLQSFNSLSSIRFLLVSFISLWSLNQLLSLPIFRRQFLPNSSRSQQINLCKIHVVLSLGFLEPGFLLTLLFLVTISTKNQNPKISKLVFLIFALCLPVLFLQIFFVFFSPMMIPMPEIFYRDYVVAKENLIDELVLCSYPLISSVVFGIFGVSYLIWFVFSCFRVVNLVINKNLRVRIYALAFTVLISLVLQILFLGLSLLWRPEMEVYGAVSMVVFFTTLVCATVGEGILVIRPIADALAVGGGCEPCLPRARSQQWPEMLAEGGA